MVRGFIDTATLTSALGAVRQGVGRSLSLWHDQSLVEVTYLLLHERMSVIPRPGRLGGEIGDISILLSILPDISARQTNQKPAMQITNTWLDNNPQILNNVWRSAEKEQALWEWAIPQRDLRWVHHSETYGALFDEIFIPRIATVLQIPEMDLRKIHSTTTDPNKVKNWLKKGASSEDAKVAEKAWVLGGIIRGNTTKTLLRLLIHNSYHTSFAKA